MYTAPNAPVAPFTVDTAQPKLGKAIEDIIRARGKETAVAGSSNPHIPLSLSAKLDAIGENIPKDGSAASWLAYQRWLMATAATVPMVDSGGITAEYAVFQEAIALVSEYISDTLTTGTSRHTKSESGWLKVFAVMLAKKLL